MTPHCCPVCNGTGLVSRPPNVAGDVNIWVSDSSGPYQCRACTGSGIVWEQPQISIPSVWEPYQAPYHAPYPDPCFNPYPAPFDPDYWVRSTYPETIEPKEE